MVSKQIKQKALKVKKIAEDTNPKRMTASKSDKQGAYGVSINNRALSS